MIYTLIYHPKLKSTDLPRLSGPARDGIQKAIEQRLVVNPAAYGLPLKWGLKGYRKLRIGDYKIIYSVVKDEIRILAIGHRKDIYEKAGRRT